MRTIRALPSLPLSISPRALRTASSFSSASYWSASSAASPAGGLDVDQAERAQPADVGGGVGRVQDAGRDPDRRDVGQDGAGGRAADLLGDDVDQGERRTGRQGGEDAGLVGHELADDRPEQVVAALAAVGIGGAVQQLGHRRAQRLGIVAGVLRRA